MPRILIADDESQIRFLFCKTLIDCGYEVIEAQNGVDALEQIATQSPDLTLLDISMPEMDGLEVLRRLRESVETRNMSVILMTTIPAEESEATGMNLGVDHFLNKPCDVNLLKSTVRVVLREAEAARKAVLDSSLAQFGSSEELVQDALIRTGIEAVDTEMLGGIHLGSLILIEGTAGAGKSVLCQHLTYGALLAGHRTAYFGAFEQEKELADQMSSLGLETARQIQTGRLKVTPLREPAPDEDPDHLLNLLGQAITGLHTNFGTIVIDPLTALSLYCKEESILQFVRNCKYRCKEGSSVMISIHPSSVENGLLVRLTAQVDTHLKLSFKKMGFKTVRILEVLKLNNVENETGERVAFEIHENFGIAPVPISQFTAGKAG